MNGRPDIAAIRRAIDRGVAYLIENLARRPDGLWRDFCRADGSGGSNVWVSGFIAAHIAQIPAARRAAASVAATLVQYRRPGGGWGYDEQLLQDADSTAWVLVAARAAGIALPRDLAIAGLRFLLWHQDASGGFVTYGPDGVALFAGVPGREGWFTPQPCVTAAALAALTAHASPELPAIAAAAAYLERTAVGDLWRAYWWYGPTYTTYVATRALASAGRLTRARAEAITAAVLGARNADGGWSGQRSGHSLAFPTALGLQTLLELGSAGDVAAEAASLLVSRQRSDGGFDASAELLVPGGSSAGTMTMVDQGPFTTACTLNALHAYARRATSEEDIACRATC